MIMKMAIAMVLTLLFTGGYAQEKKLLTPEEVLKYWRFPAGDQQSLVE